MAMVQHLVNFGNGQDVLIDDLPAQEVATADEAILRLVVTNQELLGDPGLLPHPLVHPDRSNPATSVFYGGQLTPPSFLPLDATDAPLKVKIGEFSSEILKSPGAFVGGFLLKSAHSLQKMPCAAFFAENVLTVIASADLAELESSFFATDASAFEESWTGEADLRTALRQQIAMLVKNCGIDKCGSYLHAMPYYVRIPGLLPLLHARNAENEEERDILSKFLRSFPPAKTADIAKVAKKKMSISTVFADFTAKPLVRLDSKPGEKSDKMQPNAKVTNVLPFLALQLLERRILDDYDEEEEDEEVTKPEPDDWNPAEPVDKTMQTRYDEALKKSSNDETCSTTSSPLSPSPPRDVLDLNRLARKVVAIEGTMDAMIKAAEKALRVENATTLSEVFGQYAKTLAPRHCVIFVENEDITLYDSTCSYSISRSALQRLATRSWSSVFELSRKDATLLINEVVVLGEAREQKCWQKNKDLKRELTVTPALPKKKAKKG